MSQIRIETSSDSYQDEIARLILSIQHGEFGIPITLGMQPDLEKISKFYQVNNGNFWVARINNRIVGTIALLDIGNNKGALRKMFVAKEFRGKEFSVGQSLLNNLVEWAKQRGFVEILLGTTEKFVRAQRFYERNGFVEVPRRELPEEFPIMDVDVKFYSFSIPG